MVILTTLMTLLTLMVGALGRLFWSRLNWIQANMVTRSEFEAHRADMTHMRDELRGGIGQLRDELAAMRSDLTYVALAVGGRRPTASEG